MDNSSNLNLARKWRSKNFDQIIGQELCVRILRNALYLNSFFPVYIFSGQRGCGKTSTARIFSAAINCEQLINFQKNPKEISIPCLECNSCKSMKEGKHPDFIEIDAASHTGVDNVRNIIEASSLMPLMGRKRIYLIDEAHMLSKAAFNAFLKILEEPPASVLFILATTDINKIIDTVKSRSFQLFFTSVSQDNLLDHLENICKQESIEYDLEGLRIIVRESEGSVRDAINILEQVRFSTKIITKSSVLDVLGYLSDENLLYIFDFLINKKEKTDELLQFLNDINFYSYSPDYIWDKLLELFSISIKIKYKVLIKIFVDQKKVNEIISKSSLRSILIAMNKFFENEFLFSKTNNKQIFLELLFLQIMNINEFNNSKKEKEENIKEFSVDVSNKKNDEIISKNNVISTTTITKTTTSSSSSLWNNFIHELKKLNDPLLDSIFVQSKFINFQENNFEVIIAFQEQFTFFKELIDNTFNSWNPKLKEIFGINSTLKIEFNLPNIQTNIVEKKIEQKNENKISYEKKDILKKSKAFDVSDKNKWQNANELLKYFPGVIYEVQESK